MTLAFQSIDKRRSDLLEQFRSIRQKTINLCEPLKDEDYNLQTMPDVSPPKWHLAHTTWFFEAFLLCKYFPSYKSFNPNFDYLFNSYYESHGSFHPRSQRGFLSRPEISEIIKYRQYVDQQIEVFFAKNHHQNDTNQWLDIIELGIHHEQQHQELLLMDIKYNFFQNPLKPAYLKKDLPYKESPSRSAEHWLTVQQGTYNIGAEGTGFSYDNERSRHKVYINSVKLGSNLVSNGEFLEFIDDNGYDRSELWLSEARQHIDIRQPLYWLHEGNRWFEFTLYGLKPLDLSAPVSHISYFEADAFARWRHCRLPTEFEWEALAQNQNIQGDFLESQIFHPRSVNDNHQLFGSLWEWTCSSYAPYYGFKPNEGTLGEYNGKFMSNQYVLKGGSFATAKLHIRATYRNFYPAHSRWMFSGIRLAKEFKPHEY